MLFAIGGAVLGVALLVILIVIRRKKIAAGKPVFHILKDKPGGSHWYVGLAFLMIMCGCNTPCKDSVLVHPFAVGLAVAWECQVPSALEAQIDKAASRLGVCSIAEEQAKKGNKSGVIGMVLCPMVIGELRSIAVNWVTPEAKCNPDKVGAGVAMADSALCSSIVPI